MLVVIYPDLDIWNFVLQDIENKTGDIKLIPLNRYCGLQHRFVRQVFQTSALPPGLLFGKELLKLLRSLNHNDSVLICDYSSANILKALRRTINSNVRVSLWFWNPILENSVEQIVCAKSLGFEVHTFDSIDAERYDLKLSTQFFPLSLKSESLDIEKDFYFQGYDKGRANLLHDLAKQLNQYKTHINIVHSSKDCIPYLQYIENIKTTRCLIDIVQAGQSGLTLRPLEALAFNKKLLTNNSEIVKYDFYRKENVFLLGKDNIAEIDIFLNTPYVDIDRQTKDCYDSNTWINQFKANVQH